VKGAAGNGTKGRGVTSAD
jgi:hypothetical protein